MTDHNFTEMGKPIPFPSGRVEVFAPGDVVQVKRYGEWADARIVYRSQFGDGYCVRLLADDTLTFSFYDDVRSRSRFDEPTQCDVCHVFTYNADAHVCTRYDGPPCRECGAGTVAYTVGAPGYGSGVCCENGHDFATSPQGILTPEQTR